MTHIVKYDPFAEMQALQRQFFGDDWFSPKSMQLPTTDIYTKDDKQLIAEVHLPHFSENDIDVRVDKGALEIQAEKHEQEEDKTKKYVVRESSSSFYRRFQLPETADENEIEAHFSDGVLMVTVPLKKLPAPKKISVKKIASKSAKK